MITEQNIVSFISTLYQKKYGTPAPADLLNKWSRLSNVEIEKNLNELFNHWEFSEAQSNEEINTFLATRNFTPKSTEEITPIATKKKRRFPIAYILFVLLLAGIGYVLYEYIGYENLRTVYCLTDNVSLRMSDGTKVGRMDLFPKHSSDIASFGKLVAASEKAVPIKFPDLKNEIMVRELFLKDDFISYFLGDKSERVYAASSFLTESKQEYQLFKSVFKNLPHHKSENAKLKFVHRKVIVGCLRISNKLSAYIDLPCNGAYEKKYDGIVRVDLKKGKYQIIAKLNDGKYYHFIGNATDNEFAKIRPLKTTLFGLINNNILDEDVLFKTSNGTTYLYGCAGDAKDYQSIHMSETNNQIKDFEWNYSF